MKQMLEKYIQELRSGKRDSSVLSAHTAGSLTSDEKEAWRQLRKELESVGITPSLFTQHQVLIVEILRKAIIEENLIEDISIDQINSSESAPQQYSTSYSILEPASELVPQAHGTQIDGILSTKNNTPRKKKVNAIAKWLHRITNSRTALLEAAKGGDVVFIEQSLKKGVEVDFKDRAGTTPLWWAARNGHEAIVKLLLATSQVEVDVKNRYGETPLMWAALNGHEAVVKLLLATGQVEVLPFITNSLFLKLG
jgi:hypothetical protein